MSSVTEQATQLPNHRRRIRYKSTPTAAKFHRSQARVRGIRGPVGSGKSVACVMEIMRMAREQAPNSEGIRKSRFAIIRNTYGELKSTTIKTWSDWVPEDVCPIVYDSPIVGRLRLKHPDGKTWIESEILFTALDKPKDVKKLLSLELTGAWINEAREISWAIVLAVRQRIGRYPRKEEAPLTQASLILDTNPPDTDHWWYDVSEGKRMPGGDEDAPLLDPKDFQFWTQPAALIRHGKMYLPNPNAENVENQQLGYRYWLDQVAGAKTEWIKVYLLGQYGFVLDGKLVYDEYNDQVHVRDDVKANPSLPLLLGWDFGLTPACVIAQLTPRGTLIVLDELVAEGMGIAQFAAQAVKPFLATRYPGWSLENDILCAGDPAGADPVQTDESTCFDVLQGLGFRMAPTLTNHFLPRREAVASFLTRMDTGSPSFILSSRCKVLRKGFLGGYHYRRVAVPGKAIYRDEPDKDAYSHPHDALQYLCQMARGGAPISRTSGGRTAQDSTVPRRPQRRALVS